MAPTPRKSSASERTITCRELVSELREGAKHIEGTSTAEFIRIATERMEKAYADALTPAQSQNVQARLTLAILDGKGDQ